MEANEYQQQAARTLIDAPDTTYTSEELMLVLHALRLAEKAAEIANLVKKAVFHRHDLNFAQLRDKLYVLIDEATYFEMPGELLVMSPDQIMAVWNALGLIGEAGELAKTVFPVVDREKAADEAGDNFWYLAALCTKLNIPLSEVMERNIAKLKRRFPDGWSTERSINRDVSPEASQASPVTPGATEAPDQPICATTQPEQL